MKLLLLALFAVLLVRTQDAEPAQTPKQEAVAWKTVAAALEASDKAWLPLLERDTLSTGIYRLAAGSMDGQSPHRFDEIYYVIEGKGTLFAGDEELAMETGSVAFVEREVEHRFHDIEEDLVVLVFFAKPHE